MTGSVTDDRAQGPIIKLINLSTMVLLSHSVLETRSFGAELAKTATPGDVFALIGELGCGKTEFVRGFVEALCGPAPVRSPTFSIVNVYEAPEIDCLIYHFDFYRLKKQEELVEIGYYDYLHSSGIMFIEWADMFSAVLPVDVKRVLFIDKGDSAREISLL